MNKHYIVLNGKRYDAVTGALLGPEQTEAHTKNKPSTSRSTREGSVAPSHTASAHAVQTTQPVATRTDTTHRQPSSHIKPHQPQDGTTLMRRAVARPSIKKLATIKPHYPAQPAHVNSDVIAPKHSVQSIDTARMKRAQTTHKSSKVGRFTTQVMTDIAPRVAPIRVAKPPQHISTPQQTNNVSHAPAKLSIFEQALATATSHETPPPRKARKSHKKGIAVFAGVASVLMIAGLFVFLNKQSIEMQVASWRAGFSAVAPSYVADGYKKEVTGVEGKSVSINYVSPTDQTQYTLTQEPSDWDSQSLLSTVVAESGTSYRTLQNRGRTIYIYDGNKAAWVDGGVLYTIAGSAPLRTDQIISIAASL